jgi:hypothetical protein
MLSRVAYSDEAAVRWAVQLLPDSMALNRFEEVAQEYVGSRES